MGVAHMNLAYTPVNFCKSCPELAAGHNFYIFVKATTLGHHWHVCGETGQRVRGLTQGVVVVKVKKKS